MLSTRTKGYILAITGGLWFGAVIFVVRSNLILRQTQLGGIARALDKAPSPLRGVLFSAFWVVFFLGWAVPTFCALRLLRRTGK